MDSLVPTLTLFSTVVIQKCIPMVQKPFSAYSLCLIKGYREKKLICFRIPFILKSNISWKCICFSENIQDGICSGCEKEFSIKKNTSPKAPLPSLKTKSLTSLDSGGVLMGKLHIWKAKKHRNQSIKLDLKHLSEEKIRLSQTLVTISMNQNPHTTHENDADPHCFKLETNNKKMRAGSYSPMPYLRVNYVYHRKSKSASRHSGQWSGSLWSPGSGKNP